jgi:hypothetical protein
MYVDTHPVTNAQYAAYLNSSKYHPADSANWLMQNFESGQPKAGWEQKPVTYVSLEDARAYCSHQNKRLPHVYEWQYFAQGTLIVLNRCFQLPLLLVLTIAGVEANTDPYHASRVSMFVLP